MAILVPIMLVGGLVSIAGLLAAYEEMRGIARSAIPNVNGLLISLPTVFLWIPISLLLTNRVLFVVPPFRTVAERFAAEAQRPGFRESQRQLLLMAGLFALICVPLIVLGFWL